LEIKQEKIGSLVDRLTVVIGPADYREQVHTQLKDYAKRANLKGFRKGMVPVSVVRKMFGKGLLFEELNKIVSKGLNDYLTDNQVQIVGDPLPVTKEMDIDPEREIDYELTFEIGVASPFTVDYGLAGNNPIYKIVADDALIDKEIEGMRAQQGEMTNPEESQPGDVLFGKLMEVDGDGNVIDGGLDRMYALNPEKVQSEALKAEMGAGKKAGDNLSVTMADLFATDADIRELWETSVSGEVIGEVSDETLAQIKEKKFSFEVRKINRIVKLDVDQALFDKVLGEGAVTSLADFRDRVAQDIEKHLGEQSIKLYRALTIRSLVEGTNIQLPDEFLKRWLISTRDKVTEQNIDALYPSFARSTRWRMMVEQMQGENEAVKVTQDHILERAKAMVRGQFGSMLAGDEKRLAEFANYYLQDEKMVQRLFDEELEDRVFAHIHHQNPPVEEEIIATDFIEKLKKENEG
jgi:trigger factor